MDNKCKTNKIKISYIIYVFIFIFAPPIIPRINFVIVLFLFSFLCLITKHKSHILYFTKKSGVNFFVKYMMVAMLYLTIVMYFGFMLDPVNITNYIKTWYRFFMIIPIAITCIIHIIIMSEEWGYGFTELLKSLIYAALIQVVITSCMIFIPEFRDIILKILYFNTKDELCQNLWHVQRRYYSFSHNVLDTFGYGTGILAVIPLFYGVITNKYKFFLLSPVLLIVPLFNSRTGLIIYFIGVICILPFIFFQLTPKKLLKASIIFIILLIIVSKIYCHLINSFPTTMTWVQSGINDTIGFFKGENGNDSVSVIMSSSKFKLPDSILVIIGTGHNVYNASGYAHSDVGYVNDIWLVGLFGIFILYFPLTILFIRAFRKTKYISIKVLILFLSTSFFLANIKTIVFNYNVGTSIVLLIILFIIYKNKEINLGNRINGGMVNE